MFSSARGMWVRCFRPATWKLPASSAVNVHTEAELKSITVRKAVPLYSTPSIFYPPLGRLHPHILTRCLREFCIVYPGEEPAPP